MLYLYVGFCIYLEKYILWRIIYVIGEKNNIRANKLLRIGETTLIWFCQNGKIAIKNEEHTNV